MQDDIMTNPQYIQELTKKIKQYANPQQVPMKPVEDILPTTNYMAEVGKRPLITAAPMDLEFKGTASPISALGVGIGKAMQHLYNIRALNEQQTIKDYEGKIKMAQEKDLRRMESQEKLRYQQSVERLPSEQQKKEMQNLDAMLSLGKEKRAVEAQPLEDEYKRAQIAKMYKSMSDERKATSTAAQKAEATKAFFKEILTNDKYKAIRQNPKLTSDDIAILGYNEMMRTDPQKAIEFSMIFKDIGARPTEEQRANRAEENARRVTLGSNAAIIEFAKKMQEAKNNPKATTPSAQPQGGLSEQDKAELIKLLQSGGK